MHTFKRTSLPLLFILLGIFACALPDFALPPLDTSANGTVVAQTVLAIVRMTQQASGIALISSDTPTVTLTPTLTHTPTLTPSATLSPTAIFTVTPLVPMISVSVPTNCRVGPGRIYEMVGALLVGERVQVYGRDPTNNYWMIRNPDEPSGFCWVWGEYATLTGLFSALPVYTPPPTPTATYTATPAPGFDAEFSTLQSCSGSWWVRIELHNAGSVTFRSIEMTIRDTVTDTEISLERDGFSDRTGCSSTSSRNTLGPDRTFTQSSDDFSYNPAGHKLRAIIELCSQTGMNGQCVKENFTFKP